MRNFNQEGSQNQPGFQTVTSTISPIAAKHNESSKEVKQSQPGDGDQTDELLGTGRKESTPEQREAGTGKSAALRSTGMKQQSLYNDGLNKGSHKGNEFNIVKISNFNYSTVNENVHAAGSARRLTKENSISDRARRQPSYIFDRRSTLTGDPEELKLTIKKISA